MPTHRPEPTSAPGIHTGTTVQITTRRFSRNELHELPLGLTHNQRYAMVRRHLHDDSVAQIAADLGISSESAADALHRAEERLSSVLEMSAPPRVA